ncbi:MAG TPA: cbb3-type cytochrome c oxidase subunit I [Caulobacteraceae bacterium]|nr:cbb3-type cytochrome c oxidase subunit I [Caulobacteraceae bacterium]
MTDAALRDRTRAFYIPLAWALLAFLFGWIGLQPTTQMAGQGQDTYYVVAHRHYSLSLTATLLLFALVYLGLGRIRRAPCRLWIAGLHLALMLIGVSLMLSPEFALRAQGLPDRHEDMIRAFALWNRVMATGYALSLLSLLTFVILAVVMAIDWKRRA